MSPLAAEGAFEQKGELLYEGKAKRLYLTDDSRLLIQEFKDDATAFDGKKKASIEGKGVVNNAISARLFDYLRGEGVPNHFERTISERSMLVKRLEMIAIEVVVRNIAAGSLCRRYGIEEGTVLKEAVPELYMKDDALHDPLLNEDHAVAFGLATREELGMISGMALDTNRALKAFFEPRGLLLVDFKLEFGRYDGAILLGDEISPDTCRFWDAETKEKLDKDRFRFDLGRVSEAYQEVKERILSEPVR